jgi:type II secretion system protein H
MTSQHPKLPLSPLRHPHGFTLIELVVIISLMGIVATLAMPAMFSSVAGARLSSAADEITAALQFAQLSAIDDGRPYRVTIDAAADTLLVEQLEHPADLMGAETEIAETTIEQQAYTPTPHALKPNGLFQETFGTNSQHEGVDITTSDFAATSPVIFFAQGTPSSGGSVTLACQGQQTLITLDAQSGKVTQSH